MSKIVAAYFKQFFDLNPWVMGQEIPYIDYHSDFMPVLVGFAGGFIIGFGVGGMDAANRNGITWWPHSLWFGLIVGFICSIINLIHGFLEFRKIYSKHQKHHHE